LLDVRRGAHAAAAQPCQFPNKNEQKRTKTNENGTTANENGTKMERKWNENGTKMEQNRTARSVRISHVREQIFQP
jgi:hypothetical protein